MKRRFSHYFTNIDRVVNDSEEPPVPLLPKFSFEPRTPPREATAPPPPPKRVSLVVNSISNSDLIPSPITRLPLQPRKSPPEPLEKKVLQSIKAIPRPPSKEIIEIIALGSNKRSSVTMKTRPSIGEIDVMDRDMRKWQIADGAK